MQLRIDRNSGKVMDGGNTITNPGLYSVLDGRYISNPDIEGFKNGDYIFDAPYIYINAELVLEYIVLPIVYNGEIYVCNTYDILIITDNPFNITTKKLTLYLDKDEKEFFKKKGYCSRGKTLFSNLERLISHSIYYFNKGNLTHSEISIRTLHINDDITSYNYFKKILHSVIDSRLEKNINKKQVLLLSGGIDSRLLCLLLKLKNIDFETVTMKMYPLNDSNLNDVEEAKRVCKILEVPLKVVEVDMRKKECINIIREVIKQQPFAEHNSIGFYNVLMNFAGQDICFWSGQNMDSLYNLGPTDKFEFTMHGFAQALRRFYLGDAFIATMPDVKENNSFVLNIFFKLLSVLGLMIYRKHDKLKYYLPKTSDELVYNFMRSSNYSIFSENKDWSNKSTNTKSIHDVRNKLLKSKFDFIKGGDAQILFTCASISKNQMLLPYSTEEMLPFFKSLSLKSKDIFLPKRYSYKMLKEIARGGVNEVSLFKKKSKTELSIKYGNVTSFYQAEEQILNSEFGEIIMSLADSSESYVNGYEKFEKALRIYWLNETIENFKNIWRIK